MDSNYYSIIGNPSSPTFEDLIANSTAVCLPGDVALSGDYNITGAIRETPGITYFGSLGSIHLQIGVLKRSDF